MFPMMYTVRLQLCQVVLACAQARLIYARSRSSISSSSSSAGGKKKKKTKKKWSDSRLQDGVLGMLQFVVHQCGYDSATAADAAFDRWGGMVGWLC